MADFPLEIADFEVSFFGGVKDTTGQVKTLKEVFDLIHTGGTFLPKINQIRELISQGDKEGANEIKKTLPSASFSCQTNGKGRTEDNIHQLFPLICLDIDAKDNPNINLIYDAKNKIIQERSVLACFVSPSGVGLKVIVRTDEKVLTIDELSETKQQIALHNFRANNGALVEYFKINHGLKLDPHSRSPVALNYMSYDPNLYLNWEAEPFNIEEFLELEQKNHKKTYSKNKEHKAKVSKAIKELNLDNRDLKNKVDKYDDFYKLGLAFAAEFGEEGRESFRQICQQSKGYDPNEFDRWYDRFLRDNKGKLGIGTINYTLGSPTKKNKAKKQENEEEEEIDEQNLEKISLEEYLDKFGFLDFKKGRSRFLPFDFERFLVIARRHLNLFSCKIAAYIRPLHVKNNRVYILEKSEILQVIFDYIKDNIKEDGLIIQEKKKEIVIKRNELINSVFHWKTEILNDNTISTLPQFSLRDNILHSTASTSYKFYDNGVLCIDGKTGEIELKTYEFFAKQGKYVFDNEILGRNYIPGEAESSEIARFVENISGTDERIKWCKLLLGYLAHNYTTDRKKKAVIFSDSQSIGGQESGRTGKGLLGEIVRYQYERVRSDDENKSVAFVDGKNFNSENKFKYQVCNTNTRLILLEDIKTTHNVQQHFNELLEGFNIERKNSQPFKINAKLILTTNYSIPIEGSSTRDRFWEFSLLPYYSDKLSPNQEFGGFFFSEDWTAEQWANYDAFMHQCILLYFEALAQYQGNIRQLEDEMNKEKKLEDLVGEEFINFADNLVNANGTLGFQEKERYYRKDLYSAYCQLYPKTKVSAKAFINKVRQYKKYHPDWQEDQLDKDNKQTQEGKDSRGRYIIFIRNNNTENS